MSVCFKVCSLVFLYRDQRHTGVVCLYILSMLVCRVIVIVPCAPSFAFLCSVQSQVGVVCLYVVSLLACRVNKVLL